MLNNIELNSYINNNSIINKINPLIKIISIIFILFLSILSNNITFINNQFNINIKNRYIILFKNN